MKPTEYKRSFAENFIFNLLYQVCMLIGPLVTMPYVSRVLGVENIGLYSYTTSIIAYFTLAANLGSNTYAQKKIATCDEDVDGRSQIFFNVQAFRTLTVLITYAALAVYVLRTPGQTGFLLAVQSISLFSTLLDITWLFHGMQDFRVTALRNILFKVLAVAATFVFVRRPQDVGLYAFIEIFSTLLGNLMLWFRLRGRIHAVSWRSIRPLSCLKESVQFFIPGFAVQIYTVLDKTLLWQYAADASENGYYEQAVKIVRFLTTILSVYSIVCFPKMAKLFHRSKGPEQTREVIQQGAQIVSFLGFPLVVGLETVAPVLVPVFLGEGYEKCILLLRILSPQIVIIGLSTALGQQFYNASGRQNQSTCFVSAGAALNLLINCMLMPRLQSVGAAIAAVITESMITLMFVVFARKYFSMLAFMKNSIRHLIAALLMGALVMAVPGSGVAALGIKVMCGVAGYAAALLAMRDSFAWALIHSVVRKLDKSERA